ncbi:MAG TPA: hypothetical protein VGX45_16415 [Solirubrobacteraceae bacterium]|nr:hypothetical protein [Solirubrobacteraceae bacterium]
MRALLDLPTRAVAGAPTQGDADARLEQSQLVALERLPAVLDGSTRR